MLLLEQLQLFEQCSLPARSTAVAAPLCLPRRNPMKAGRGGPSSPQDESVRLADRTGIFHGDPPPHEAAARQSRAPWPQRSGRDYALEETARGILSAAGAARIGSAVRVLWNPRLQTAAGRADYRAKVISLNPRLHEHGMVEIDRTLRHELAHLLAQFRSGRRRVLPHGPEWRDACRDLGISDEMRCHNLPFPTRERARRFLYKCPNCFLDFPRARRIRRAIACLACCRAHNGGEFDARFRLRLVAGAAL